MNILFFLKPKSEVAYVHDYGTLRQVLETMEYHKYASIPMLNKSGEYVGTITEGDLLWGIKRYTNLNLKEAENIFIQDFPRKVDYVAVSINSDMEDLLQKAMNQNCYKKEYYGILLRKIKKFTGRLLTCSRMICYILTVCRTMRFKFCKTDTVIGE